jgi:ATP-binding cassette, subfamily B, bacterial
LDKQNEREVMAALERLAQGRTTLLITHDLHLVARADLILYLEGGRAIERGTHAELMQKNGYYAALYRMQRATRAESTNKEESNALNI